MPVLTVTRRLRFNAAHRVHNTALSDAENVALFGKCNNPNWHGHNYLLEVSVTGEIDPRTGYVMDLAKLRDLVERELVSHIDHKNLNLDVPFMAGTNPTTENLVVACSALRRAYRDRLGRSGAEPCFVHLSVPPDVIRRRVQRRRGHFMPESLLQSQIETLEPPSADEENVIVVDANRRPEEVVGEISSRLDVRARHRPA